MLLMKFGRRPPPHLPCSSIVSICRARKPLHYRASGTRTGEQAVGKALPLQNSSTFLSSHDRPARERTPEGGLDGARAT